MSRRLVFSVFVIFLITFTSLYAPVMADTGVKTVFFVEDGMAAAYTTPAQTVRDFLAERGVVLAPRDTLNKQYADALESGSRIELRRGFYVNVSVDGNVSAFKVSQSTPVGTFIRLFTEQNGKEYRYNGSLSEMLTPGETIFLTEYREETVSEKTEIPFETQTVENNGLAKGAERVAQEGAPGEKTAVYRVVYLGGVEQSREVISEDTDSEPIDRIIEIGTAEPSPTPMPTQPPKPAEAPKPQAPKPQNSAQTFNLGAKISSTANLRYTHVYTMLTTAYTAGPESTGKSPGMPEYGITYTGMRVCPGVVSVDPNVIPLGTHLYVEGYGYSIAADIGGDSIQGYHIDLYMESLSAAYQWGRRTEKVYVLD